MARRPTSTSSPAQSIVASARKVDLTDREAARKAMARPQAWQADAWMVYNLVGTVKYPLRYRANAVSRLRLFAATKPVADAEPMAVDDPESGIDVETARKANDAIARLKAEVGGQRQLIWALSLNLDVAAECYLVGEDERPEQRDPVTQEVTREATAEKWAIYSVAELRLDTDGTAKVYTAENLEGRRLDPETTTVVRIWNPHPQWSNQPDCELRGVLLECDELLILSRMIRAQGRSRLSSGILFLNNDMDFGAADRTVDPGDGQARQDDPFAHDLMTAMMTPIQEEGDATAVVPMIVRGKGDQVGPDKNWLLRLDRPLDALAIDLRKELKLTIAQGLPVPPEVALGMGEANHWSAWTVTEDSFKNHIEPQGISVCDALTAGYLTAMLIADGVDPEVADRIFVWYDETELVTKPNRAADAKDAHDRLVINDKALRDALGFSEADAPTEEEIAERIAIKRGQIDSPLTEALLMALLPQIVTQAQENRAEQNRQAIEVASAEADAAAAAGDGTGEEGAPPEGDGSGDSSAVAASARPQPTLGDRLAAIDATLATRLEVAFDMAMDRALERAGARLRSKVAGAAPLRDTVRAVPQHLVAATLGRALVAAQGVTDDELLDGAFGALQPQFDAWVAAAQAESVTVLADTTGPINDERRAAIDTRQAEERAESWAWTLGALVALAHVRLYDPNPSVGLGEAGGTSVVPTPLIREAMTRAGGAAGLATQPVAGGGGNLMVTADDAPAGLVATGQTVMEVAREQGATTSGWEWRYAAFGTPATVFPGHRQLDGVLFDTWTDDRLMVQPQDSWLSTGWYRPGDHKGCRCFAVPRFPEGTWEAIGRTP